VQALVVVPVHPREGLQFEVVNRLPWPSSRASREFGFVESVDGFGEGVDAPICQELIMRPPKEQFWPGNLPSPDRRLLER